MASLQASDHEVEHTELQQLISVLEAEGEDDGLLLLDRDLFAQQQTSRHPAVRCIWSALRFVLSSEWFYLFGIGLLSAVVTFSLGFCIDHILEARVNLWRHIDHVFGNYVLWVVIKVAMIMLAVYTTHLISPHAVGSGIPEMKTVFRSRITLDNKYLGFRTLCSKFIGLVLTSGGGLPVGKEGPSVHISSAIANLLSIHVPFFRSIANENDSRRMEFLAAACAVGVASTFGSPVGGVLFSIEVTASGYFAVRNYWRGFFSAVVGAVTFGSITALVSGETIVAVASTDFPEGSFAIQELLAFAGLGVVSALLGALFVLLHSRVFYAIRALGKTRLGNRYQFTALVAVAFATLTFPGFIGEFMALTNNQKVKDLFSSKELHCLNDHEDNTRWSKHSVFLEMPVYLLIFFFFTTVAMSLRVPAGVFMPVFVMGAVLGRLTGEIMNHIYPLGIAGEIDQEQLHSCIWQPGTQLMRYWYPEPVPDANNGTVIEAVAHWCRWNATSNKCENLDKTVCFDMPYILPGIYAVVGAAALTSAVTHTISTSVIVFEMTGQMRLIIPVLIAVLISNAIAQQLAPSIYDSIIQMKNLPYLPDIHKAANYQKTAGQIMKYHVPMISLQTTYQQLSSILRNNPDIKSFPLVDTDLSRILLGAVSRAHLRNSLLRHVQRTRSSQQVILGPRRPSEVDSVPTTPTEHHRFALDASGDLGLSTPGSPAMSPAATPRGGSPTLLQISSDDFALPTPRRVTIDSPIDFSHMEIDPAPLRLVEQSPLAQIHTMFSLMNMNEAYVTSLGKVIGFIDLRILSDAILENEGGLIFSSNSRAARRESRDDQDEDTDRMRSS